MTIVQSMTFPKDRMFEADDVINLLNGLHGGDDNSCASELFLDEDGLPTDRFLQALKADSVLALTHSAENGKGNSLHKQNHHNHNTVTAADSSEEDDYGSDSESSSSNDSEVQRSSRRKSRKEKPVSQKKGKSKSSGKSSVDKAKREKSCENGKRKKKSDGKKAPEKAIDQFPLVGPFELPSPKTRGKSRSLVLESDSDSKYPQSYRSFLDDKRDKNLDLLTEIEIETDAKIRKLNLRLQGQLQTIRTLETQLSDSHEQLESKNKQISQLSTKVKQLESKANNVASTPTAKPSQKTAETRNALKLEELKTEVELLQTKLNDEQIRRQRADDRSRTLKDYAEKFKERCHELEGLLKATKASLQDANNRTQKFRKSYKDIAAEFATHKEIFDAKDTEIGRQKQKTKRAEAILVEVQKELDKARDELRNQKVATQAAISKSKALQLSIDVEHEKLATKRAEKRLQALRRQGNKKSNQLLNNSQVVHQSDSESDVSLNNVRGNTSTNSNKELPRTNEHANKLATARASWEEMQNYIHMSDRQLDKSVLRESSEFQRMLKERMLNSDNSNNSVSRGNNNRPYSHQSGDRLESPTRSSKPPLPLEKVQYNSDDLRPMRSTAPTAELVSAINSSGIAFKPKVSMTPDVSDSESISREKAAKTVEFVRRKALSLNDSVESFGKRSVSFVQDSKNSSPIRNNSVLTSLEHSIRESRETLKQPSASSTEAIEKKSPVREQLQRAATMEKPRAESAKQQFERLQLLYEKVSSFK